jgi:hypothetical protein
MLTSIVNKKAPPLKRFRQFFARPPLPETAGNSFWLRQLQNHPASLPGLHRGQRSIPFVD